MVDHPHLVQGVGLKVAGGGGRFHLTRLKGLSLVRVRAVVDAPGVRRLLQCCWGWVLFYSVTDCYHSVRLPRLVGSARRLIQAMHMQCGLPISLCASP